jgi:hypothetical protein
LGDAGSVYVVDFTSGKLRKVSSGQVTTLIDTGLSNPRGVWVYSPDIVYVGDTGNNRVLSYTVSTKATSVLISAANGLSQPSSLWGDTSGNLYIAGNIFCKYIILLN